MRSASPPGNALVQTKARSGSLVERVLKRSKVRILRRVVLVRDSDRYTELSQQQRPALAAGLDRRRSSRNRPRPIEQEDKKLVGRSGHSCTFVEKRTELLEITNLPIVSELNTLSPLCGARRDKCER